MDENITTELVVYSDNPFIKEIQRNFGQLYQELISMEKSENLDEIDTKIRAFLEKNTSEKGEGVTSSQLRNVFAKVKAIKIDDKAPNTLKMLRPNLAYIIARQKNAKAKSIMYWLDDLIEKVKTKEDVKQFKKFLKW